MRCKGKSLFINQKKIPYNLWHNAITKKRDIYTWRVAKGNPKLKSSPVGGHLDRPET